MHAETTPNEQGQETQPQIDIESEEEAAPTGFFGSIMDVLMPANPPAPKNARVVRRFDLDATKGEAKVEAPVKREQPERRSREEVRAMRNRSLRAAAGLD